jgi:M-phase inducer tyrosine phosphatase
MRGAYSSEIASFQIFDCRFEYEFQGGHIAGAFNINSAAAIEERLLKQNGLLPKPSSSGDGSGGKVILIFHCEFSKHRAPTMSVQTDLTYDIVDSFFIEQSIFVPETAL